MLWFVLYYFYIIYREIYDSYLSVCLSIDLCPQVSQAGGDFIVFKYSYLIKVGSWAMKHRCPPHLPFGWGKWCLWFALHIIYKERTKRENVLFWKQLWSHWTKRVRYIYYFFFGGRVVVGYCVICWRFLISLDKLWLQLKISSSCTQNLHWRTVRQAWMKEWSIDSIYI